jgi:hypothetical protein
MVSNRAQRTVDWLCNIICVYTVIRDLYSGSPCNTKISCLLEILDILYLYLFRVLGRAIAQAVSRRLPTAAVRGSKPDLGMWDFAMDKSGAGAGFLRELRFPLPIYIPSALHNHLHYHPRLAQ